MITLALGEIIWGLAYRWISLTNGDNGISVASAAGAVRLFAGLGARLLRRDADRSSSLAVAAVGDLRALAVRRRACAAPAISRAA